MHGLNYNTRVRCSNAAQNIEYCVCVFLDFPKAPNITDHEISLTKLVHYGIWGIALECIKHYMSEVAVCVIKWVYFYG